MTTRVAIYARVSTGEQSPEAQLRELRVYAEHRGFLITREYVDQASGDVRKRRRAPEFEELMADARRRRFDCVLVWKYDRFARTLGALISGPIDWTLIAEHLPDMLRVALSIKAGRLLPSAILRRLGTYSRKNRLYFAFRELGRAIRTGFLLRYIGSVDLRRTIGAATNKSEHFNRYAQWAGFGGGGLVTAAARDEQRKMIKYNHLVANLLIFHTAIGMTRALDGIAADGWGLGS